MSSMNIQEILKYLPHRYPFLLIDKVLDYEVGKTLVALKNISVNEPFFLGHFPGHPVTPGVVILESMAQASGILIYLTVGNNNKDLYYFAGIDNVRFRRVVVPGDQLTLHVSVMRNKLDVWKFNTQATVGSDIVCTAEIMIAK